MRTRTRMGARAASQWVREFRTARGWYSTVSMAEGALMVLTEIVNGPEPKPRWADVNIGSMSGKGDRVLIAEEDLLILTDSEGLDCGWPKRRANIAPSSASSYMGGLRRSFYREVVIVRAESGLPRSRCLIQGPCGPHRNLPDQDLPQSMSPGRSGFRPSVWTRHGLFSHAVWPVWLFLDRVSRWWSCSCDGVLLLFASG